MSFVLYCVFAMLTVWTSFAAVEEFNAGFDDSRLLACIYGVVAVICFIVAGCV